MTITDWYNALKISTVVETLLIILKRKFKLYSYMGLYFYKHKKIHERVPARRITIIESRRGRRAENQSIIPGSGRHDAMRCRVAGRRADLGHRGHQTDQRRYVAEAPKMYEPAEL
jgi:hypothetical protein